MLWIKALHLIFMVAWFAGLFYLPRLFVYHAMSEDPATRETFRIMERKLYRFVTPFMILTVIFGLWMLYDYAWQAYREQIWLQIKLFLVSLLLLYHFYCGKLVRDFARDRNIRNHRFYRWFNELPVLLLFAIVILAVVRPA
ncbi:MAG TPA: protoporphyrinogen oxidase HemJ [Chromatiales bacterium]|nr:protoporphyrinogen oxidase HemJ [Chromatiales bacterium]